jgi:hypothetical protein
MPKMRMGESGQHGAFAAHGVIERGPGEQADDGEHQAQGAVDDQRVGGQGVGLAAVAGAQGARDGRGDAAAHGTGGHHLHQHEAREDQCDAGQGIVAETADIDGLDQAGGRLGQHDEHVGPGELQECGQDGRVQQLQGARGHGAGRGGWFDARGGQLVHMHLSVGHG